MTSQLDSLSTLGASFAAGAGTVMERAGLPVERAAVEGTAVRQVLAINPQAFEEYAQAREYMRSPDLTGSIDHAIGLLQRAVERDSSFVLAHAGLAEAYWQKYLSTRDNAWTDKARASALDAIRLDPDDPIVRYTLALIYRGMGRRDDALSEVTRAIGLQPSNDDLYRLRGRLHADAGQQDLALSDLNVALSLRHGYWENHQAVGLTLFGAGRYMEAAQYFQRVTELRPSSASAYQALGTAYHAANQIPPALAAYEKAISIAPSANTYSNIGKLHYDTGRFDDARRAFEESIRIQPKAPVTHRNLGDTLQRLGLTGRARASYESAIALAAETLKVNPTSLGAISLQALCHAKLGNGPEARRLAAVVTSGVNVPAGDRYRAGVALVLVGDPRGVDEVVTAIADGHSRSEAALDVDLASVRGDSRLAAALAEPPSRGL
jgi:tetratricopeptide (TPR) repeat protein